MHRLSAAIIATSLAAGAASAAEAPAGVAHGARLLVRNGGHEPLLVTGHVGVGLTLIVAGLMAMALVKGSPAHKLAGRIFVTAILVMAASGAVLVVVGPPRAMVTAWAALAPFYLGITGWLAARQQGPGIGPSEVVGAAVAGFMGVVGLVLAETASNVRVEALFVGSAIAFLFAAIDIGVVLRRGLSRPQRIRRHLWRMGFAVVVATAAIFPAQSQRYPVELRPYLPLIMLPPLVFTLYQIVRYRARTRRSAVPAAVSVPEA